MSNTIESVKIKAVRISNPIKGHQSTNKYKVFGSKEIGWLLGTEGVYIDSIFDTYDEVKHFIGFWNTLHNKEEFDEVYDIWYDKYMNDPYDCANDTEFKGQLNEWNYKHISIKKNDEIEENDENDEIEPKE